MVGEYKYTGLEYMVEEGSNNRILHSYVVNCTFTGELFSFCHFLA